MVGAFLILENMLFRKWMVNRKNTKQGYAMNANDSKMKLVLNMLTVDIKLSKNDIASTLNKSERTIQRIISSLTNKGLIERIGTNKDGYWKVVDID